MKKSGLLIVTALVSGLILCGCAGKTATPAVTSQIAGDTQEAAVTVEETEKQSASPERIVVLTAADCEVVYALGLGDKIVGRGEYCDYPAEVLDVPSVQSGYETNIEQIISLNPDLVLMGSMDQKAEVAEQLEKVGITTYRSRANNIDEVYTMIKTISTYLGADAEKKADTLIESLKAGFADIKGNPISDGTKTVYFEVSPLQYGLWTAGNGTFMNEAAEMIGLKNCFDDVTGWAEISEEQVLERNPDYIVTVSMYYGEGPTPEEEILARTGWESVTAVKEKKILNLRDNELSRPGPRLLDGVKALYEFAR